MSDKFTTGELSKRCSVSVRTVQYYDKEGLLKPSELSQGGRRLYTEEDMLKLSGIINQLDETEIIK
ncbi:MAG: MerR family transcriptional regulator [Clostridiaceae bacterium]